MGHAHDLPEIVYKVCDTDCGLIVKAARAADEPLTFVISSESVDLAGDVVVQDGMKPARVPIPAQTDHAGKVEKQIGTWRNFVRKGRQTLADLYLLPPGISPQADLVRALADAGLRLAASIGFAPNWAKTEEITDKDKHITGFKFLETRLLEVSVVVVPAQPEALQVRSLLRNERDRATLDQMIAERRRGLVSPSVTAGRTQPGRPTPALLQRSGLARTESPTMKLSEKIVATQAELNTLRDEQKVTTDKLCEEGTDEERAALEEQAKTLADQIILKAQSLDTLKAAEDSLKPRETSLIVRGAQQAAAGGGSSGGEGLGPRSLARVRAHRDEDVDGMHVIRAAGVVMEAFIKRVPVSMILEERYPGREIIELVTKAAQNPAMTNVPGWAQELVRENFGAFMDLLQPESIVPRIPMQKFSFDGYGKITIPRRASRTPSLAAAFRAEGAPIRVGRIALTSAYLTPKSMAVIAEFTQEMFDRSTPNIEQVCRDAMLGDTAVALDMAFLGATAGTPTNPAGLQTYATGTNTAASTGNTVAQITADLRARVSVMTSKGFGRRPVWVMSPDRLVGLQLATTAAGTPAFASAANGILLGFPVYTSLTVPSTIVYLIDAAEVAFAGGTPVFKASDQATVHEEDTTPLPIGSTGAPAVVAAPVRSFFQTNTLGLRAVWEVDWNVLSADGPVQTITAVAW